MTRLSLWCSLGALVAGTALLVAACGGGGGGGGQATGGAQTTGQKGGEITVNLQSDTDYTDPALAYYQISWQQEYATCLKLLNYPDDASEAGSQLQPEAAESMPEVSADGKTYTFTVKSGFKFSPPSTEEVTADTFKFVMERSLNPKMQSPSASFMSDIAGAPEYLDGKAKSISGIQVEGNKITFTLTDVAPDFLSRIAMPFFCAIPTDTPVNPKGERTVPSAGPYYISERTPKRRFVLTKNPNYTGDRPANLDKITYVVGVDPAQSVLQIKQGQVDYVADGTPPAQDAQLIQQFGEDSPAAAQGKQQFYVNPTLAFRYVAMNTTRPPFDNLKVRQAVNYAIDRQALLQQQGAEGGTPTDQYLPSGIPGFKDADIYPLDAPDVDMAKQLMQESGVQTPVNAVIYTCNTSPCPERAQIIQANLKPIGINVQIKQFERAVQFEKEGTKGEPFELADEGWIADYADPFDFINILLYGPSIQQTGNVNFAYFNDPAFNKKMLEASRLSGDERFSAYADLDADIVKNGAPLAAWDNDNQKDFFSSKVGCQLYHPVYTMDLATLCLR